MFYKHTRDQVYYQVALVASGSDNCGGGNTGSLYTKITAYNDWLMERMRDAKWCTNPKWLLHQSGMHDQSQGGSNSIFILYNQHSKIILFYLLTQLIKLL